jgi:hypothetical protein
MSCQVGYIAVTYFQDFRTIEVIWHVGIGVLTAVVINVAIFRDKVQCSSYVNQRL